VPAPASLAEARLGAASYEWADVDVHPYPTCFVCGPGRAAGDGMRVFPGPLSGRDIYAAPWQPDGSLLDGDGWVAPGSPAGARLADVSHRYVTKLTDGL